MSAVHVVAATGRLQVCAFSLAWSAAGWSGLVWALGLFGFGSGPLVCLGLVPGFVCLKLIIKKPQCFISCVCFVELKLVSRGWHVIQLCGWHGGPLRSLLRVGVVVAWHGGPFVFAFTVQVFGAVAS